MGPPKSKNARSTATFTWKSCAFLAQEHAPARDGVKSFVTFNPLGVVLAIVPWNFPIWQVFRFAAPWMMAWQRDRFETCANVPACALAIEDVFHRAGSPEHLFRMLMIESVRIGVGIENPLVRAMTPTGGGSAGRAAASEADAMLKKPSSNSEEVISISCSKMPISNSLLCVRSGTVDEIRLVPRRHQALHRRRQGAR